MPADPADARQAGSGRRRSGRRTAAALAAGLLLVAAAAALAVLRPSVNSPASPAATALTLSGDLRAHDPALVAGEDDEPWYVFSTGDEHVHLGAIQIRTSPDGREWTDAGTVWDSSNEPRWVFDEIPGVSNFWAPEVVEHDGTYYLYYAASTFGSNLSLIGLFTNTTLDPAAPGYAWVDQGEVIRSVPGKTDFNAIDPGVVEDADARPWMAFGSFWGGIQLVQLEWPSGKLADPDAPPVPIASRIGASDAIEAPYLVAHDGYFYLFVSRDSCCRGIDSTYNIAVGRAAQVTGPYLDRDGQEMATGGGTLLLGTRGDRIGPGGQSVSRGYLAFHYYDATLGGDFQLAIRELGWDADGWPVVTTAAEEADPADG